MSTLAAMTPGPLEIVILVVLVLVVFFGLLRLTITSAVRRADRRGNDSPRS